MRNTMFTVKTTVLDKRDCITGSREISNHNHSTQLITHFGARGNGEKVGTGTSPFVLPIINYQHMPVFILKKLKFVFKERFKIKPNKQDSVGTEEQPQFS